MSLLRDHWRRLTGCIHPDDEDVFKTHHHCFNLDFPPPAFIGNPDAPIVVLMSNGGYKSGLTEKEFQTQQDRDEHIAYLHGTRLSLPERLSAYYKTGLIGSWVKDGWAVFVNAIPYRSPKLSAEPANRATAKCLTSLLVHKRWLLEEAVPAAHRGEKTIFVHRNGWWQLAQELASERIIFSDAMRAEPNRSAPDREKLLHAGYWLRSRMQQ